MNPALITPLCIALVLLSVIVAAVLHGRRRQSGGNEGLMGRYRQLAGDHKLSVTLEDQHDSLLFAIDHSKKTILYLSAKGSLHWCLIHAGDIADCFLAGPSTAAEHRSVRCPDTVARMMTGTGIAIRLHDGRCEYLPVFDELYDPPAQREELTRVAGFWFHQIKALQLMAVAEQSGAENA